MQELCRQFIAFANDSTLAISRLEIKIQDHKKWPPLPYGTNLTRLHLFKGRRREQGKVGEGGGGKGGGGKGGGGGGGAGGRGEGGCMRRTRLGSQINNGLLTGTLLPVICMQRSARRS